ncbi:MAG: outer membrane beta-barrel protein, partial [Planctomycetota bacterium]
MRAAAVVLALAATTSLANEDLEAEVERVLHYLVYADTGYSHSSNQPGNRLWRSKTTTYKIDRPVLNLAVANLWKEATAESRWGFEFGLQMGADTELGVPDVDPVWNAEVLSYFHRASASYLFPLGEGLEVTGGLIPGYPGYESFFSLENPTYTRGYITDYVPYFLFGVRATYPVASTLDLSLFVVTGYDYLVDVNDAPSLGLQATWSVTEQLTFTQNLYWGPDQEDTAVEYWRFFSDSILEYRSGPLVLAFAFDIGTEKQAAIPGNPRNDWLATAFWVRWEINKRWWL